MQDVPPDSTHWDLLPRLADEGGKLLVETLRRMQAGTVCHLCASGYIQGPICSGGCSPSQVQPITQDPALVTKAPKIRHDTARIQWTQQTAAQICALHRGIGHQVCHQWGICMVVALVPSFVMRVLH